MVKLNRLLWLPLVPLLLAGCATTTITNLTPSRLPRKENGQYPFAVEYATRQATLLKDTMKAYVVIGEDKFPMERTPMLTNRFETLVPIPPGQDLLTYRYRFDYEYRAIPAHEQASRESKYYQLTITPPAP